MASVIVKSQPACSFCDERKEAKGQLSLKAGRDGTGEQGVGWKAGGDIKAGGDLTVGDGHLYDG